MLKIDLPENLSPSTTELVGSPVVMRNYERDRRAAAEFDAYPVPGERFLDFELISELGRGSMGRVFLARQPEMGARQVVLKMAEHLSEECQRLAKLQHPNIVPIHSFHQSSWLQVVCMPFRGTVTLAQIVNRLQKKKVETLPANCLSTLIAECKSEVSESTLDGPTDSVTSNVANPPTPVESVPSSNESRIRSEAQQGFVESVLRMIREVAEGLGFAHSQGIVHSDLKPANVLISSDGQAQLLDFGIAFDKASEAKNAIQIGGTRAYMSLEQLKSFQSGELAYDERTDLYAVGVMLYEMLTGRLPYESSRDHSSAALDRDLLNRQQPPVSARQLNRRISAGVEAIITRCLAPRVEDRYQTAAELIEDIDRQLDHRPLKFARNESRRELIIKWATRNRLTLVLSALSIIVLNLGWIVYHHSAQRDLQSQQIAAASASAEFRRRLFDVEFLFELARNDAEQREKAWAKSRAALELLNAWNDDRWFERQGFKSFASEQLGSIREEVAQLFGLLVRDRLTQASRLDPGSERDRLLQEAETWNERLIHTHPSGIELRRVWVDRLELAHMRNQSDDLAMIQSRLEELPRATSDLMEEGRQLLQKGKSREALTLLVDLLNANPQHYWASFYAGLAEHQLGKYPEAISHFDRCESLVPGFYGVWFNRATTAFAARNYAAAEADYSRVLESRPEWAEVYFNRARSREGLKRYREALDDLDLAMEHGYSPTLIYLMRSRLHASRTTRLLRIATSPQLWKRHRPMNGAGWLGRCYSRKATLRLP